MRKAFPLAAALLLTTTLMTSANATATPRQRATELVAQLTLDEKINQLAGIKTDTEYRTVPAVERLGIPKLLLTNGPAGVSTGGIVQPEATALPAPLALAASWDVEQARRYGDIEGAETLSVGRNVLEGPTVNIARVPVNGRNFEAYGEDPYLASQFAVHNIKGIQARQVIANVKHFFGNNQEASRFNINNDIDERTMREIYLPAFEASVKDAAVGSVMCAYPKINGTFNCENPLVLNQILKQEWGFDGFVFSDFGAVHSTAPSVNGGLDLETPTDKYFNPKAIKAALADGTIKLATLHEKLVRRYTKMIEFGLFDRTPAITPIPAAEHGKVARELAADGMVLLKNERALLPLDKNKTIALIGKDEAKTGGGGSSRVKPLYTVKPSAGLKAKGAKVITDDGTSADRAAATAKSADVAIVMVEDTETEGKDRPNLALSGDQDALVDAVAKANPNTVVVAKTGGPVLMPWLRQVPALLQAWYPGEEDGNAVADVLFGDVNPSAKLPVTFPAFEADQPASTPAQYPGTNGTAHYSEGVFVGYRHYDAKKIAPLFPFGYGLSYTKFDYANLKLTKDPHGVVTVDADVTNTGTRGGAEIAQLYVGSPSTMHAPEAPRELQGFQKVSLSPGQTQHIRFTLQQRAFAYWDTATHWWRLAGGAYQISVGGGSRDLRLQSTTFLAPGSVPHDR
ncbi:glycoside hydrolase family 3 C-terminal domain-containing protein [Amycolatopsis sp. NPDC059657]|uniref:beta-glucosidase n=1 Tax=Amycolatopsis sp. NPDC059657 TaxID=3346899 RepID=UPI003671B671